MYMHATTLGRASLLCGEIRQGGWWYYFPFAMAFKTPLATIIALACATASIAVGFKSARPANLWPIAAAVVCPVIYMGMAMQSPMNVGIRHILPVYPYLFILIGVAAAKAAAHWPRPAIAVIGILFLGLATETYAAFPDYIPFFNVAVGGERGGLKLLDSTNVDWGQELPALARWQQINPNRQMYLCYLGFPEPHYYNIHYVNLPGSHTENDMPIPEIDANPVVAISAELLQGGGIDPATMQLYEPFRHIKPIEVLGGAIFIFDAPPHWRQTLEQYK